MAKNKLRALYDRARQAYQAKDFQTAEQIARQILARKEDSAPAHILLGTIFGSVGRHEDAIGEFKRAIELQPENPEAFNDLGVIYRQMGNKQDALYWITRAIALKPDKAEIHYNLGNIHKMLHNHEEAVQAYEKAIGINRNFAVAYNNLGTLYEERGDFVRAEQFFQKGLAGDRNNPTLHYNLGLALQSEGKLEEARVEYERSLKSRPGWTESLNNLGIVYQKMERYDESIRAFQEMLKIDPESITAHNNIATVLAKQGRNDEAIAYFKRALTKKPDYVRAAVNLGQILETYRNQNESLEELRHLVSANEESADIRFQLVRVLINLERYAEAEKHLKFILGKDPNSIRALQELGGVYTRIGKNSDAAECYRRLQTLDPDNVEFRLDLGRILRELGQFDAAIQQVKAYLGARPDDLRAAILLGEILCAADRAEEAVALLEGLKEKHPENGNVLAVLADAYRRMGDRERAIGTADELINLQGNRADPEDIDKLNESLGLYERAVEAFEREHQEQWQRNLERLGRLTPEGAPGGTEAGRLGLDIGSVGQEPPMDFEDSGFAFPEFDEVAGESADEGPEEEPSEGASEGPDESAIPEEEFGGLAFEDSGSLNLSDLLGESELKPEEEPEFSWPGGEAPDLSALDEDTPPETLKPEVGAGGQTPSAPQPGAEYRRPEPFSAPGRLYPGQPGAEYPPGQYAPGEYQPERYPHEPFGAEQYAPQQHAGESAYAPPYRNGSQRPGGLLSRGRQFQPSDYGAREYPSAEYGSPEYPAHRYAEDAANEGDEGVAAAEANGVPYVPSFEPATGIPQWPESPPPHWESGGVAPDGGRDAAPTPGQSGGPARDRFGGESAPESTGESEGGSEGGSAHEPDDGMPFDGGARADEGDDEKPLSDLNREDDEFGIEDFLSEGPAEAEAAETEQEAEQESEEEPEIAELLPEDDVAETAEPDPWNTDAAQPEPSQPERMRAGEPVPDYEEDLGGLLTEVPEGREAGTAAGASAPGGSDANGQTAGSGEGGQPAGRGEKVARPGSGGAADEDVPEAEELEELPDLDELGDAEHREPDHREPEHGGADHNEAGRGEWVQRGDGPVAGGAERPGVVMPFAFGQPDANGEFGAPEWSGTDVSLPRESSTGIHSESAKPAHRTRADERAEMLDYLVDLSRQLPRDRTNQFEHSEFKLRIEALKSRLRGSPGLLKRMKEYRKSVGPEAVFSGPVRLTPSKIADMFAFLRRLSGCIPDNAVGELLQERASGLLKRLTAIREQLNG